jgi:diacylglycerol kinase family enzyme
LLLLPVVVGLGRARPERDIEHIRATEAVVTSRKRHLRVAIDGEAVFLSTPLRYESLPGRLIVRCPPGVPPSLTTEPEQA